MAKNYLRLRTHPQVQLLQVGKSTIGAYPWDEKGFLAGEAVQPELFTLPESRPSKHHNL